MLVDCDIHHASPNKEEWLQYLDEPYRTEFARNGPRSLLSGIRYEDGGSRWDASAAKPEHVVEQLLNKYGHRFALLTGNNGSVAGNPDPDYAAAVCKAYNDFTIEKWLPVDDRFVMSMMVPMQDPQLAVREIERLAGHPRIVSIEFWAAAERIPFGSRFYWPIYEAAQRHNLPIHVHPSTINTIAAPATSAAGNVTNYLQAHTSLPQFYQAHTISLVLEGVFEVFPGLKIALIEGGFAWAPHVLWRMDKEYKGLRQQAPRLRRLPSEYVRDHVRFGTQPIEEPKKVSHLEQIIDMLGGPEMLLFCTDFPHWDFDEPSVLPKRLGEGAIRKILHDNAVEFFNLPKLEEDRAWAGAR